MNAPIHAVVPIKETSDAKRRLADVLCAARLQELALAMFEDAKFDRSRLQSRLMTVRVP